MTQYDLLVVGGGAAGLTAAETGRLLGLRVAMVALKEEQLILLLWQPEKTTA